MNRDTHHKVLNIKKMPFLQLTTRRPNGVVYRFPRDRRIRVSGSANVTLKNRKVSNDLIIQTGERKSRCLIFDSNPQKENFRNQHAQLLHMPFISGTLCERVDETHVAKKNEHEKGRITCRPLRC